MEVIGECGGGVATEEEALPVDRGGGRDGMRSVRNGHTQEMESLKI